MSDRKFTKCPTCVLQLKSTQLSLPPISDLQKNIFGPIILLQFFITVILYTSIQPFKQLCLDLSDLTHFKTSFFSSFQSQSPILKPYYQLLVSNHKIRSRLTMEECLANPDDSFVMGIIEPLRSLHGQESIGSVQCVILIDGLCDSELHRPDLGDTIGKK